MFYIETIQNKQIYITINALLEKRHPSDLARGCFMPMPCDSKICSKNKNAVSSHRSKRRFCIS